MSEPMFELVMPIDEALRRAAEVPVPHYDPPEGGWLPDDLVDALEVDPTFHVDPRYATDNNFMGAAVYDAKIVALQRPVAEDLARVHSELKQDGFGIILYDGYRPFTVTVAMWLVTPEALQEEFLANPKRGSIHNRGAAVDLGLYHTDTGETVTMPSDFDEFTQRADVRYNEGPPEPLARRDHLIAVMADHGFRVYQEEWWHFNHPDAKRYRINTVPLSEIEAKQHEPIDG